EITEINTGLARMEEELNEVIADAKLQTSETAAPLQARKAALEAALYLYAKAHKTRLFSDRRTVAMAHGTIGFRATPELRTAKGLTWDKVLAALKDLRWRAGIRVKESVNKDVVRAWEQERLDRIGVRLVNKESFWYRTAEEEIPDGPVE
ncbi:MAG: host-nuclease inhibitor Gam family protein, partial [Nitrospinota bacterium]|nr:host-nuclease inhibitor Gam family protein [Nitrospinota bacterium]